MRLQQPIRTVAQELAVCIAARANCAKSGNTEWFDRWTDRIDQISRDYLPSGSGVDSGTIVDLAASKSDRIVLAMSYHHMHASGCYDGWSDYRVTIRPDWDGVIVTVQGAGRNGTEYYLAELCEYDLTRRIVWDQDRERFELADTGELFEPSDRPAVRS